MISIQDKRVLDQFELAKAARKLADDELDLAAMQLIVAARMIMKCSDISEDRQLDYFHLADKYAQRSADILREIITQHVNPSASCRLPWTRGGDE